jgi:2-methylcitrate dehydratase
VGPEQLATERIRRADVQTLLRRVQIRPNATLTAGYPQTTPVQVSVTLRGGRRLFREQKDFEGVPSRPLSWERTVQKFHWLAEPYASDDLRNAIARHVEHLGDEPLSRLGGLLNQVSQQPRLPRTRHAI